MRQANAWGRVQLSNEEDRIGKPKDVFSRNPTGYPMWTEAMKAAIGPLRRAGRKWYSLYDKVIAPANVRPLGTGLINASRARNAKREREWMASPLRNLRTGRKQNCGSWAS